MHKHSISRQILFELGIVRRMKEVCPALFPNLRIKQLKIFEYCCDKDSYAVMDSGPKIGEEEDDFFFDNVPRYLEGRDVFLRNTSKPLPDFFSLCLKPVLTARAYDILCPYINSNVECVELDLNGAAYKLLNFTEGSVKLDENKAVFRRSGGNLITVDVPVFSRESWEGSHLFYFEDYGEVYLTSVLKEVIDEHQLSGLLFDVVGKIV